MIRLRSVVTSAAALILTACAPSDPVSPASAPDLEPLPRTNSAGATTLWSQTFVRENGKPIVQLATVTVLDARATQEIALTVVNGRADGTARSASARVTVNGKEVIAPSVFNANFAGETFLVPIGVTRPVVIGAELSSAPGTQFTLSIAAGAPVTTAGGTLPLAGGTVAVSVPAGAVTTPIAISAEPVAPSPTAAEYGAYEFGPDGTQFALPLTITLPYPAATFPAGSEPGLYYRNTDADEWEPLENATFDAQSGTVSGTIDHFTQIGVRLKDALVCPGVANAIATMDSALKVIASRGVVRLCETAEHVANNVLIAKPVTIVSAGGTRARVLTGASAAFTVQGVSNGSVTLRSLSVTGSAGIHVLAQGAYDEVVVDSSDFTLRDGATSAVYAFPSTVNGARVTVRAIRAVGGNTGVVANGAPRVDVVESVFEGQKGAGNIRLFPFNFTTGGALPNGSIVGNTFSECARLACISVDGADQVTISDNAIATTSRVALFPASGAPAGFGATSLPGVRFGISVSAKRAIVMNNTIAGVGDIANVESLGGGHPIAYAGIAVQGRGDVADAFPMQADVIGNVISGAYAGVSAYRQPTAAVSPQTSLSVTARENGISRAAIGATLAGGPSAVFQRNNVLTPLSLAPVVQSNLNASAGRGPVLPGSLACNWFGDARGPQRVSTATNTIGLDAYLPFASQPVAGEAGVNCVPGSVPLPLNVRYCPTGGTLWDAVPTVGFLTSAIASTRTGGTLDICAGSHAANGVTLNRAMTVRGEAGSLPIIDGATAGGGIAFYIYNAGSGQIAIQNLHFRNARNAGIQVEGSYDRVIVENSTFEPTINPAVALGNGFFSGVNVGNAIGNGVTVRNNAFSGGDVGVNSYGTFKIDVHDNTFANHANAAVFVGGGAQSEAQVRNNVVNGCGAFRCLIAANPGAVVFRGNTLNIPFTAPRTTHGIEGNGQTMEIVDNRIVGSGGTREPFDQSAWPALIGIKINDGQVGQSARVDSNTVTGVWAGMRFDASTVTGTDNVVSSVSLAIDARNGTTTMRRSDFTNYTSTVFLPDPAVPAPGAFTCNYWGNSNGPAFNQGGAVVQRGAFLPAASQPIARTPGVACNPTPAPLLTTARVCPVNGGIYDATPTFQTLPWAIGNTAAGGTVLLCDAEHVASDLQINKPLTLRSESGTRARIVPGTALREIIVSSIGDGDARFERLDFRGTGQQLLFVVGSYRTVEIRESKFTLTSVLAGYGLYTANPSLPNSRIVVTESEFMGGLANIFAPGAGRLDVSSSRFSTTTGFGNIQFQTSTTGPLTVGGTIVDSEFDDCGAQGCIRMPGGVASLTVSRNRFRTTGRRNAAGASVVQAAVQLVATSALVEANVIEGLGGIVGDPAVITSYPFNTAAIQVFAPGVAATVVVNNNRISGAARALLIDRSNPSAQQLTVQGTGNIAVGMHTGLLVRGGPLLMVSRNDFVSAAVAGIREEVAVSGRPSVGTNGSTLTCNWWGTAAGPIGVALSPVVVPVSLYAPVASAPIAVSQSGCAP